MKTVSEQIEEEINASGFISTNQLANKRFKSKRVTKTKLKIIPKDIKLNLGWKNIDFYFNQCKNSERNIESNNKR